MTGQNPLRLSQKLHQKLRVSAALRAYTGCMEPSTTLPAAAPAPVAPAVMPSHTTAHPVLPPHTKTDRSTLSAPEPFIRIFLLAWAIRYIPRGLFGELFEKDAFPVIKRQVNKFIDSTFLNRMEGKINRILTENKSLVEDVKARAGDIKKGEIDHALFDKIKPFIRQWRGNASKEVHHIVTDAVATADGGYALAKSSKSTLRDLVRGKFDGIAYSLSLFAGSSWLSFKYSKLVRADIQNLFCETVGDEKGIPPEKVTFRDIAQSDNRIIQGTVANYRSKLWSRLGSDSLFLVAAPLKSMPITDFVLGWKGVQMFHDTWRRNPTVFEDFVTFVNNKINPINGLGQPINIGEVFDLYQHYAQTYAPERAFTGVVEHSMGEGARWAENQVIFQRLTELMNKTYAYKHQSILDVKTGHTLLQADFALPKLIYLLGHDLIDVRTPKQTLVTIEIANSYGITGVKDMQAMLKSGQTLEQVQARYHVTLPTPETPTPETTNSVIAKGTSLQLDAQSPAPKIKLDTIHHTGPHHAAHTERGTA